MDIVSPSIKKESLTDLVVDYLKQGILSGKYHPGDRLVESEIAECLKVSRSSVREAIRFLEADNLIQRVHQLGPVVASVNYEDAKELYIYRALLEGFAVFEFARLASNEEFKKLKLAMKRLRVESDTKDTKKIMLAVTEVYEIIFTGSKNRFLKESLIKLLDRINLFRLASLTRPNRITLGVQEMEVMADYIYDRDAEAARQAAIEHVEQAAKAALAAIQDKKSS